jgi:GNAT superfamily N-acetyltransferase
VRRRFSLLLLLLTYPLLRVFAFSPLIDPLPLRRPSPRHPHFVTFVAPISTIPKGDVVAIDKLAQRFTHQNIKWVLRPCENPSWGQMWQWRLRGCFIYLQYVLRIIPELPLFPIQLQKPSPEAVPPSLIVMYAYHNGSPIGRFGIVPDAGESAPPEAMQQVAQRIHIPSLETLRAAAIIYMFVEPEYRGRSVGSLALAVISHIHASRGCQCTVLVANDSQARKEADEGTPLNVDKSQVDERLVQWYERHGYIRAPELQELLGSPQGVYGITMMAPTLLQADAPFRIQWW